MIRELTKRGMKFLVIFLCMIYIVSPIDFMPEGVLGPFGFIDDVLVGIIMILAVLTDMDWVSNILRLRS